MAIRNVRRDALIKQTKKLEIPEDALTALQKKVFARRRTGPAARRARAERPPEGAIAPR